MQARTEGEAAPSSVPLPLKSGNFYLSGMPELPAALAYSSGLKAQVLAPAWASPRNKSDNIQLSQSLRETMSESSS